MVYEKFLDLQLDYIYLVYGLTFFLLAHACLYAGRHSSKRLPWTMLGLFALLHGTHELLDLTAIALGDSTPFAIGRYFVLAGSFAFLLEFGRRGTVVPGGGNKSRLALPLLFAASLIGARYGIDGLNASARYALGLTGGLWASIALFTAARDGDAGSSRLVHAGVGMVLYALATGLIVRHAPFFPASVFNYDSFSSATGIPVQLVKLGAIFFVTFSIVYYFRSNECPMAAGMGYKKPQCSFRPIFMVLAILIVGWFITEMAGRHVEGEAKANLISRTLTAAASIPPGHVAMLTGTPADEGRPEFEELRDKLQRIKAVNPDCRFMYLMGLRGDKEIFLVDAEPKGSKDYSTPGDVYPDATPEDVADFKNGQTKVYMPYTDSWGTWVSGVSFIRNPATGEVAAMLGMDIAATVWLDTVYMTRYFCMVIIFVVSMLVMVLYDAWQRDREAAEQGLALRLATQRLADEEKLRDLVNSLGEGVIVHDAYGLINFANPEAEKLLGWGGGGLSGMPIDDAVGYSVYGPDGRLLDGFATHESGAEKGHRVYDAQFARRDGSQLAVSLVTSPIYEDGKLAGAVMAFQDITERRNIERQKNDFYAMVTHDLKSPLVTIQGYSDLLLEDKGKLDDDSITMVENIRESGRKMLRMVNDFLTVSRLEFGNLALNEDFEDIAGMVAGVISEYAPLADQKNISLVHRLPENQVSASCDRVHLQRAIGNLVQNAIHYTSPGGNVVVAVGETVDDGRKHVMITVSDTGPGIPSEDKEKIFNKYYRSPKTSGLRGSGLGLAIVKAVVTAHGGRVELESTEGKGSTFRLYIPATR